MSDCCLIKKVATVEVYENKNEVRAYGFMAGDKNTPMMEVKFRHLWGEENLSKCKLRWIIVDDLGSLLVGEVPIEQDNTASIQLPNELFTGERRMKVQLTVASCDGSRILNLQQFTDLKVINNLATNEVVEPVYQMLINQVYDDTKKYLAELETSYKAKYGSLESVYAKSKASLEQYLINAENGGNAEFLQGYNPKNFNRVENTINELVNSAGSKYKVGDVVEVLGYYTAGDGAHHKRKIESTDDGSGVQLANGLWANIVHNGEVNVSWFGAKGDGVTDESEVFEFISKTKNVASFIFPKNIYIKLEKTINLPKATYDFLNNTLKIEHVQSGTSLRFGKTEVVDETELFNDNIEKKFEDFLNREHTLFSIAYSEQKTSTTLHNVIYVAKGNSVDGDVFEKPKSYIDVKSTSDTSVLVIKNLKLEAFYKNGDLPTMSIALEHCVSPLLENISLKILEENISNQTVCLRVSKSYDVTLKDIKCLNTPNRTGSYCFSLFSNTRIKIDSVEVNKTGNWYSNGNFHNTDIVIKNSILDRFDSHINTNNITMRDTKFGVLNLSGSKKSDVVVENCEKTNSEEVAVIRPRTDNFGYGGECGNIKIKSLTTKLTNKISLVFFNTYQLKYDYEIQPVTKLEVENSECYANLITLYVVEGHYKNTLKRPSCVAVANCKNLLVEDYTANYPDDKVTGYITENFINVDFHSSYQTYNSRHSSNITFIFNCRNVKDVHILKKEGAVVKETFSSEELNSSFIVFESSKKLNSIIENGFFSFTGTNPATLDGVGDRFGVLLSMKRNDWKMSQIFFASNTYLYFREGDVSGGMVSGNWVSYSKVTDALNVISLNTPYHTAKMQQLGIYEDFISYMDSQHEYDKEQKASESAKQEAYQLALTENSELVYEEWLSSYAELMPVHQEPVPSEALQAFYNEYK